MTNKDIYSQICDTINDNDLEVTEIVRCKNCKHYVTDDIIPNYCNYHTNKVGFCDDAVYMSENDYCSYGEERIEK